MQKVPVNCVRFRRDRYTGNRIERMKIAYLGMRGAGGEVLIGPEIPC